VTTFTATAPYDPAYPPALALYCSDGRFTEPVEELLRSLGHPRLDTLTLPGGPGLLNHLTTPFADMSTTQRAASFLITSHGIREVFLIAHHGCGYYKHRMAAKPAEAIQAAQVRDLLAAGKLLTRDHAGLVVHPYYATIVEGRVRFEAIAPPG
jgi:hypothetical protein